MRPVLARFDRSQQGSNTSGLGGEADIARTRKSVEIDPKATLYNPRREVGAEAMVSRESVGLHLVFTPKSESDLGCTI